MHHWGGYLSPVSQVSVCSATAPGWSSRHALRPVLILGGFIAIWWALMTGVAQADTDHAPRHQGLEAVRTTAKAHLAPVRDAARRVHHEAKATTSRASAPIRHQVRPATKPITKTVTSVVSSTPVLEKATRTISATVSDTVATTHELLGETVASPIADVADEVVKDAVENGESSTGQGNSHPLRHQASDAANTFAGLLASTSGAGRTTSASTDGEAVSTTGDRPANGPPGAPTLPDPCTSPSGSGSSSSFAPAGVIESSLLVTPSVHRDLRSWRLARLPGGPAYEPGSSPD